MDKIKLAVGLYYVIDYTINVILFSNKVYR